MLANKDESILQRLQNDTKAVNGILEKYNFWFQARYGFERALPDTMDGNIEDRVKLVHVLLQLVNSKIVPS